MEQVRLIHPVSSQSLREETSLDRHRRLDQTLKTPLNGNYLTEELLNLVSLRKGLYQYYLTIDHKNLIEYHNKLYFMAIKEGLNQKDL